jgi:hypothetical protein
MNMKGKLRWLVGAALLSATMILGGCVAESADEEEEAAVGETSAALSLAPPVNRQAPVPNSAPSNPGADSPLPIVLPDDGTGSDETGNGVDPQPQPWVPQTTDSDNHDGSGHHREHTVYERIE